MQKDTGIPQSKKSLTPQQINERNRQFWIDQSKLMDERISNDALIEIAVKDVRSETLRNVPVRSQKCFEQALADAEAAKTAVLRAFSRKGGEKNKPDALQTLIEEVVQENPSITGRQLLGELKGAKGAGTVSSINKESDGLADVAGMIHFVEENGTPKIAPISGLKDRLSRAKRKILSR